MSLHHPIENRLRPPVEWNATLAAWSAAALAAAAPSALMMIADVGYATAGLLTLFGAWRARQGWGILCYQHGLRQLPLEILPPNQIPVSSGALFLGRGFQWGPIHTQRLADLSTPEGRCYLEPGRLYRLARGLERTLPFLGVMLGSESPWNPVRPIPDRGGLPALHGVGLPEGERDVALPAADRPGHIFVIGTTGSGKTRAAELFITQDIRRGDVVIILDPKGDPDLFLRTYVEAHRTGRDFACLHLGHPAISWRYNPIGRFEKVQEVATRISHRLESKGDAAAFRQFAWLFTEVIASAQTALGERPTFESILRDMRDIEPLLVRYLEHWLDRAGPAGWRPGADHGSGRIPSHLKDRDRRALALVGFVQSHPELQDGVAAGLIEAWQFDRTYFDKISVAAKPFLRKMCAGEAGKLLNPSYADPDDARPILDFESAILRNAVVYIGLDALTDGEIAHTVAQSVIADLTSLAGRFQKHGIGAHLPGGPVRRTVQLHLDEFKELVSGEEIDLLLDKGRSAGFYTAVYGQTMEGIRVGAGSLERAGHLIGNLGTLMLFQVRSEATARLLTDTLDEVKVYSLMLESGSTDSSDPDSPVHFTSNVRQRLTQETVPLVKPGQVMQLPVGQAFVLMRGGRLCKVRVPLLAPPDRRELPPEVIAAAADMRRRYHPGGSWTRFESSVDLTPLSREGTA